MTERLTDAAQTNIAAAEILAPYVTGPIASSDMDLLEIARNVADQLARIAASEAADDADIWTAPELQYLSEEDYALPPADPALLASANRMLGERMVGIAHALRGSGVLGLSNVQPGSNLQQAVSALTGAYQMARAEADRLQDELTNAHALADKLQHLLTSRQHECEGLRAQVAEHRKDFSLQNVGLDELLEEAATHLEDGMRITLHAPGGDTSTICVLHALGSQFACATHELSSAISCAAELASHRV